MAWEQLVRDLVGSVGLQGQIAGDARNAYLAQQQAQAQIDQLRAAQSLEQRYQADVAEYLKNPTPEMLNQLVARYPQQAQALRAGWQAKDTAQVRSDRTVLGSAYAALKNKRPDLALATLRRRRDAEKARALDTSALNEQIAALESNDPNAIKTVTGALLAQLSASDENFGASYENIGGEVRGEGLKGYGPGTMILDAEGNVVRQVPFAPRVVTVGEGQTAVEYQPGGGGPASGGAGGDVVARMVPITLQSESGNRDFAPDGSPLTSSAGAVGRMQVMPGTNTDPGFGVRPAQDNSMEERARVGRDYLAAMVDRYGNPAQAWAAYNAGPGRVDQAIQEGGANWLSRLPQETQAYVRKNMAQLQGGSQGGAPRVIAQGAPKQRAQYRVLSPQEVQALGLNPSLRYQQAPDGQVTMIGGQDTRARQGRVVPDSTAKRVEGAVAIRDTLSNALSSFRDDYAGNTLTGGLESTMQGLLGTGTPGQRDWWANFKQIDNQIRNDLFGSALTATEKAAYEATTISERMDPAEVRRNLQRRAGIIRKALARQQNFLKKNGYDPAAVDALYGVDALSEQGTQGNPIPVRSRQEALKHRGKWIMTPDGRIGRVK